MILFVSIFYFPREFKSDFCDEVETSLKHCEALHLNKIFLWENKIVLCEFGLTRLVIQTIRNANKNTYAAFGF